MASAGQPCRGAVAKKHADEPPIRQMAVASTMNWRRTWPLVAPMAFWVPIFLVSRAHVLVVCGDAVDEAVKNDIAVAGRLNITATTLDGILTTDSGQNQRNPCVERVF